MMGVIPDRSWLGDEASFDWAKVVNLNRAESSFNTKLNHILKLHFSAC